MPTVPSSTQLPATATPTLTATQTYTATPTVDIAEDGFDITAVEATNIRDDIVKLRFYYRFPGEYPEAYIQLFVPPDCRDSSWSSVWSFPHVNVNEPLGWAEIEFKLPVQGECTSNSTLLSILPVTDQGTYFLIENAAYEERFDVDWQVVRDFPTINTNVLTMRNFAFEALENWKGVIRFDYIVDPRIPLEHEEIRISMRGWTNACSAQSSGEVLTEYSGTYEIYFDLERDRYDTWGRNCLQGYIRYTFNQYALWAIDNYTDKTVIFHLPALSTTFLGSPPPTANPSPTRTLVPTSTPLPPTATPIPPLVSGIPGAVFHRLCEAIKAENPRAGCPIVALPGVLAQNNRFLAFVDQQRNPTGYGIDLDNPQGWCGGDTGTECDLWLVLRYTSWCNDHAVGMIYCLSNINETTKQEIDKCYSQGSAEDIFVFPISRSYLGILNSENIGTARNFIRCP